MEAEWIASANRNKCDRYWCEYLASGQGQCEPNLLFHYATCADGCMRALLQVSAFFSLNFNSLFPHVVHNWKIGVICFVVHCSCVGCMSTFCHYFNFYLVLRCIVFQNGVFFFFSFSFTSPFVFNSWAHCFFFRTEESERVHDGERRIHYCFASALQTNHTKIQSPHWVSRVATCAHHVLLSLSLFLLLWK